MIKRLILFSAVCAVLLASTSFAQPQQHYFKFTYQSKAQIETLSKAISIDNVQGDTVYAYATDPQFNQFVKMGYDYQVLPNPGTMIIPKMAHNIQEMRDWDAYPTYDEYVNMMYQFAADYPSICTVTSIGNTVEGRELLVAKISKNVNIEEEEPEVFYTSTMHGDETTGYVLMLRLIDSLLTSYGTDPRITNLIDNMEIYINPLANPDGTYHGGNNTVYGAIRYNANWVDPNRNFPDPDEGPHPDGNPWQPETIAMMNFADAHSLITSANFHGGAEVVNYPWDTWSRRHADDTWFIAISREYADTAHAYSPSGYMTDLNNGITNGWDWYTIAGGRQDYMNYYQGCREVTIELSHTKLPNPSQLPDFWDYNKRSFLNYIENAFYGIHGVVTDAETGLPIDASIYVLDHDVDNSQVYTDPDIGDYYRMIAPGNWDLKFTADGYTPVTVENVNVSSYDDIVALNAQLEPFSGQYVTIFQDDFSSDLGWDGLGGPAEWTIGAATGGSGDDGYGGPDPSEDHSPSSDNGVLGNDLTSGSGGDYNPNIGTTYWVTSPVIDCSDYFGISLTFYRWLGVEQSSYDHAYLEAYDGSSWVTLFSNGSTIDESSWNEISYDVQSIADGNPSFRIRFGLGPTDGSWQYCGWNIDDLEINGYTSSQEPNVSIDMIPDNPPVEVPQGGSFTFTGILTNNTAQSQTTDVWIMLDVPGYGMYGPLNQYNNVSLSPNQTITVPGVTQDIPTYAPLGTYDYISYCGDYPNSPEDSASFEFTVISGSDSGADAWTLNGWFDEDNTSLPMTTALSGNYPNPFNPTTTIAYNLAEASDVELNVYNLLGEKVATLVKGHQDAGHKSLVWNASNYSSGVYFCKLTANGKTFSKRMMLIK